MADEVIPLEILFGNPERVLPRLSPDGTRLAYHVLDRGIGHVYIRPATPRLHGKVERSHRIDADEFYKLPDGVVIDDTVSSASPSASGRTSATSTGPTEVSAARPPMRLRQKAGATV